MLIPKKIVIPHLAIFVWSAFRLMGQSAHSEPTVKRVIAMDYPWLARMAILEGTVELTATISPEGTVEKVRIVSGPGLLAESAKQTLSRWLFTACTPQPSDCEAKVVVVFTLSDLAVASENCPIAFEVDLPGTVRVKAKKIHAIVN